MVRCCRQLVYWAADGANSSKIRALTKIGVNGWDYRQDCLLINVDLEDDAPAITWQQFYPSGPRSFLPLAGKKPRWFGMTLQPDRTVNCHDTRGVGTGK